MGAFTPKEICNIDETRFQLFGDQSKRRVNDTGTLNDISGHLNDKTVRYINSHSICSENNHRLGPILIFKGKGQVSAQENFDMHQWSLSFSHQKESSIVQ